MNEAPAQGKVMNVTDATDQIWQLGGLSLRQLSERVARGVSENNFLGRASELAFDFLFALFPLILFMVTLFGLFASRREQLQASFLSYFANFLPYMAFQLVRSTTIELAATAGKGRLIFSIVLGLWFGSGGIRAVIGAMNQAYQVKETRGWLRVRILALCLTLIIALFLLLALLFALVGDRFVDWLADAFHWQFVVVAIWKSLRWPAALFFILFCYSLIYFFCPSLTNNRRWRWITPGSSFGTLVFVAASLGLRAYLHFFNDYNALYGSLGAAMILLAWLYVGALSLLVGAEINAEIDRAARQKLTG